MIADKFFETFEDVKLLSVKKKEIAPVLNEVAKFFQKNKIVLYGGTAINMYLSNDKKFYGKYDIPDYDGFHIKAKDISLKLIELLKQKKYEYLMVKYALHDGTYKVSWSFKDIADITDMNKTEYEQILKTSTKIDNFLVCNINLLKSNAYIELGMPKSSLFRWGKVYKRVMLLESEHPISCNLSIDKVFHDDSVVLPKDLIETLELFIKMNRMPLVGLKAVQFYLKKHKNIQRKSNIKFPLMEVLSDNIYDTIEFVKNVLSNFKDIEYDIKNNTVSQIVPETTDFIITLNNTQITLLRIHNLNKQCVSVLYSKKNNFVYGSIFYLLYIYYYELFMGTESKLHYNKALITELLKNINESNFTTDCYGVNKSISVIKKSRARKRMPVILAKS